MKLKILGYDYDVGFETNMARDDSRCGYHCANALTIRIDPSLAEQETHSTLIHEIVEALNRKMSIGLEHEQIERLEAGFYSFLKDNNIYKVFEDLSLR